MKVALVHYWLVGMRGGEKVMEQLCGMFPQADIFTHVVDRSRLSEIFQRHQIRTTFISKLPFATRRYQDYLPLMPLALEQLDLRDYDLVISSESGPAKGVLVRPDATHICYCHTPMRYVWHMYNAYREYAGLGRRWLMAPVMHYLRVWDRLSAEGVDCFVGNSRATAQRIRRYYNRESVVIYPPVDVDSFDASDDDDGYYLMVGQLVPYKRTEIAIEAFNRLGLRLHVVGDGSEAGRLRRMAQSNVEFVGWVGNDELRRQYSRCKALVFPGEEDFGIVPVEAMASGKPVIAYGRGGALETVIPGKTGILFERQAADCLEGAVRQFEADTRIFDAHEISAAASRFSTANFRSRMLELVRLAVVEAPHRTGPEEPVGFSHLGPFDGYGISLGRLAAAGQSEALRAFGGHH